MKTTREESEDGEDDIEPKLTAATCKILVERMGLSWEAIGGRTGRIGEVSAISGRIPVYTEIELAKRRERGVRDIRG